jgi:hypothetical protein
MADKKEKPKHFWVRLSICLFLIVCAILLFNLTDQSRQLLELIVNVLILIAIQMGYQLIYDYFLKEKELDEIKTQLGNALANKINPSFLKDETSYKTFKGFAPSLSEISFPEYKDDEHNIDMVFINFTDSFLNSDTTSNIINRLKRNEKTKVRMLLMNPCSIFIRVRDKMLNRNDDYIRENHLNYRKLNTFINQLKNSGVKEKQIEIKYYDNLPAILFIKCDKIAWYTPLWVYDSARKHCFTQIDMSIESDIAKVLDNNFECLLKKSMLESNIHDIDKIKNSSPEIYLDYIKNLSLSN